MLRACLVESQLAITRWKPMLAWLVATPRAVSRHVKGHPYLGLVATPNSGRNTKQARPCHETKSVSQHQLVLASSDTNLLSQPLKGQPMSRHQSLKMVSRHQNGVVTPLQPTVELSDRDTRSCVATPKTVSRQTSAHTQLSCRYAKSWVAMSQ